MFYEGGSGEKKWSLRKGLSANGAEFYFSTHKKIGAMHRGSATAPVGTETFERAHSIMGALKLIFRSVTP
ncbi:MAG: hypothetical protein Kow0089_11410 [Desulfobulbaceae bacterium]